ncbi:GIY-YIG nuclease family protein [Jannaschia marina]|uniref:hypothetical protein n=1 Tax=Jannaschia marina TaxID=2741674 RepID=UPI001ABB8419|nr:hypothetical protein [Jannaschia marina]
MGGLRGDVQAMIRREAAHVLGSGWLETARKPNGLVRLRIGDALPILHVVFLGRERIFVAPPRRCEAEHRTVRREADMASGRPIGENEIAVQPLIQVDLVTDPVLVEAGLAGRTAIDESKVSQPSQIFCCPAHLLLRPQGYPKKSFVLYQHIFGSGSTYPDQGWFYVGITTRSWQKRWAEHRRAIESGSPLLFHRKFREEMQAGAVTYVNHKIMGVTDDLEALYEAEKFLVEGHWHDGRRLNMVPGGKSALRYMRQHGMITPGVVPMPDERDRVLQEWMEAHPRKGMPAPWISEKWADNDWPVAQICGREDRLSVKQVRAIRSLAESHGAEEIARRIGARNVAQVERVILGQTYSRVE